MQCHRIDDEIIGDDMQMVAVELDPGETVIAEAGAMNYLQDEIEFEARMGDGSVPDPGCLVAFTSGIDYAIERAGSLKSMFFGGEGFFLATLRGTGIVWIQSLPFSRLADRVLAHAPRAGGQAQGEGSLLRGLGTLREH